MEMVAKTFGNAPSWSNWVIFYGILYYRERKDIHFFKEQLFLTSAIVA